MGRGAPRGGGLGGGEMRSDGRTWSALDLSHDQDVHSATAMLIFSGSFLRTVPSGGRGADDAPAPTGHERGLIWERTRLQKLMANCE